MMNRLLMTGWVLGLAMATTGAPAQDAADADAAAPNPFLAPTPTRLPYDTEYPVMHYERTPTHNAIARLQQRLTAGDLTLTYSAPRGYLDSLLAALGIDRSSQVLVYSKTSLQKGLISAATPRALYFDADTYVGYVQGSANLELGTMDAEMGQVFYVLPNRPAAGAVPAVQRETLTCLACHDTYEMSGGGVPRFLLSSSYVNIRGDQITHEDSILTTDETPLESRWGGWYVTGHTGRQVHVGNILVRDVQELVKLDSVRRGNIDTLADLFDTTPYLSDKSDVVALLVLQHQVTVQNLLTRVNFEVRNALARVGGRSGAFRPKVRDALREYLDDLAKAMMFGDAVPYVDAISGNSGFDAWFQQQGPRDANGHSLRELDLHTRLFRHPLSFLVYSASFDALPPYAQDYLFGRFAAVLRGRDHSQLYAFMSDEDRRETLQILASTKPSFAQYLARHP
ncbi:MAG TPA: hypothetical protein VMC02_09325 [Steroidobacteraceae bacterium]|nr:hypothetical protein [Steroidobacteraceae bacterium]